MKKVFLVLSFLIAASTLLAERFSVKPNIRLNPDSGLQMYVAPNEASVLRFTPRFPDPPAELDYSILDYEGKKTGTGTARYSKDSGKYELKVSFPAGFYELSFPGTGERFGVLSIPPKTPSDHFFAVEAILSHPQVKDFSRNPNYAEDTIRVLRRAGIDRNREHYTYSGQDLLPGKSERSKDRFYLESGKLGLRSVFFFGRSFYEKNLIGLDESIASMVRHKLPGVDAFQILNETNNDPLPGSFTAPWIKVASYGLSKAGGDLPLIAPGFCCGGVSTPLFNTIDNDLLDYIDVFAFHDYASPETIEIWLSRFVDAFGNHPKKYLPVWITETGSPWARGPLNDNPYGKLRAEIAEDQASALSIAMKAVEAKACGIQRYYAFTLPFFPEHNNNFGMLDAAWSPMRITAAYFRTVYELSGMEYAGDWKNLPAGLRSMRVFSGGGNFIAVLYSGTPSKTTVSLAGIPFTSIRGMDGRELDAGPDKKVEFSGGMAYVTLKDAAPDALNTATGAMKLLRNYRAYRPVKRRSLPVVYRHELDTVADYTFQACELDSGKFLVKILNLSDKAVSAAPRLVVPDSIRVLNSVGKITVPPRSSVSCAWVLDLKNNREGLFTAEVTDPLNPGTELRVPLLDRKALVIRDCRWQDPSRWQISPNGTLQGCVDGMISFSSNFRNAGFKVLKADYLLDPERENFDGGIGVTFTIECEAVPKNNVTLRVAFVAVDSRGNEIPLVYNLRGRFKTGRNNYYVPLPGQGFHIRRISFWICTTENQVRGKIGDLKLCCDPNKVESVTARTDFETTGELRFFALAGKQWNFSLEKAAESGQIRINELGATSGQAISGERSGVVDAVLDKTDSPGNAECFFSGPECNLPVNPGQFFRAKLRPLVNPGKVWIGLSLLITHEVNGKRVNGVVPLKPVKTAGDGTLFYDGPLKSLVGKKLKKPVIRSWAVHIVNSRNFSGQRIRVLVDDAEFFTPPAKKPRFLTDQ